MLRNASSKAASHLPHEANIEQFFSRAGNLSDPNQKPSHLAALVSAGANRGAFCPTTDAILEKYFEMFRGKIDKEGELPQAASG